MRMKLARADLATRKHSSLDSDHSGFTRGYLPLVSYYSQVESAQQKLLANIFNPSAITCEQCSFVSHAHNTQVKRKIPQGTNRYRVFCKLRNELYCTYLRAYITYVVILLNAII